VLSPNSRVKRLQPPAGAEHHLYVLLNRRRKRQLNDATTFRGDAFYISRVREWGKMKADM
jgi:hypothetical protein